MEKAEETRIKIETLYRSESRRMLATLIGLLGDFDLAEEALHEAFAVALEKWPTGGIPENPRAWLVSTGRFKAIDGLRRSARFNAALLRLAEEMERAAKIEKVLEKRVVEDDRLRLIFTCCHPALQAAIAAAHSESSRPSATDWEKIVGLYDLWVIRVFFGHFLMFLSFQGEGGRSARRPSAYVSKRSL